VSCPSVNVMQTLHTPGVAGGHGLSMKLAYGPESSATVAIAKLLRH
jgi:hypothetical protein